MSESVIQRGRLLYVNPDNIAANMTENYSFNVNYGDNIVWNAEDYNINLDLEIVTKKRNGQSKNGFVSLFRGSEINGKDSTTYHLLTDSYSDASYNEMVKSGANPECLGITSVDINFDAHFYPVITMKFCDVRGMSLISPSEYEYCKNIEGKKAEEKAQSFFKSFFRMPYPEFRLTVKGNYGTKIEFKLAVKTFSSEMNSQTGNFNISVEFIGYMYGLYTELPFSFMYIAPYIGLNGGKVTNDYWNQKIADGTFTFDGGIPIPTLLEFYKKSKLIKKNIQENGYLNNANALKDYSEIINKKQKLSKLKESYDKFKNSLLSSDTEGNRHYWENTGVTTGISDNYILFIFDEKENWSLDEYPLYTTFKDYLKECKDIVFPNSGNTEYCRPFYDSEGKWDNQLTEIFKKEEYLKDNGIKDYRNKYFYIFKDNNFSKSIEEEISSLGDLVSNSEQNAESEAENVLVEALGFTPTIENIYRMLFAHIDCFMHSFYGQINDYASLSRTFSEVGIDAKETDCKNMENSDVIPYFPAFFKTKKGKRYDYYPGENSEFRKNSSEINFVNSITDAIRHAGNEYEETLSEYTKYEEQFKQGITSEFDFFPVNHADLLYNNNQYTTCSENVTAPIFTFIQRMLINKGLNGDNKDLGKKLPEIEAYNYLLAHPDKSDDFYNYALWLTKQNINSYKGLTEALKTYKGNSKKILGQIGYNNTTDYKITFTLPSNNVLIDNFTNVFQDSEGWNYYNENTDALIKFDTDEIDTIINGIENTNSKLKEILNIGFDSNTEAKKLVDIDNKQTYGVNQFKCTIVKNNAVSGLSSADDILSYKEDIESISHNLNKNAEDYRLLYFPKKELDDFEEYNYKNNLFIVEKDGYLYIRDTFEIPYSGQTIIKKEELLKDENNDILGLIILNSLGYDLSDFSNLAKENNIISVLWTYALFIGACVHFDITIPNETDNVKKIKNSLKAYFENWITTDEFKILRAYIMLPKNYTKKGNYIFFKIADIEKNNALVDFLIKKVYLIKTYRKNKEVSVSIDEIKSFLNVIINIYEKQEKSVEGNGYIDNTSHEEEKFGIYRLLKTLYDKWLSFNTKETFELRSPEDTNKVRKARYIGNSSINNNKKEFDSFLFVDSFYNDISKQFIVNPSTLIDIIEQTHNEGNVYAYSVFGNIAEKNNLLFLCLPVYNNFQDKNSVKDIFTPHPKYYDIKGEGQTYLLMYTHEASKSLPLGDDYQYEDDGIYLDLGGSNIDTNRDEYDFFSTKEGENNYVVPVFQVDYAKQSQSYFTNIRINMDAPKATMESIKVMFDLAQAESNGDTINTTFVGQDLYSIYSNRSYTCTVDMMGCINIMPTMYFQLNNVLLFKGLYMIYNVKHHIEQGKMLTTFSGVRVSKNKVAYINNSLNLGTIMDILEKSTQLPSEDRKVIPEAFKEWKYSGEKYSYFNINKAVERMEYSIKVESNKYPYLTSVIPHHTDSLYLGWCARAVTSFISAGFNDSSITKIGNANEMMPKLEQYGFKEVSGISEYSSGSQVYSDYTNYNGYQKGDIAIYMPTNGTDNAVKYGHICMYDGTSWVSDTKQKNLWCYSDNSAKNIRVYRYSS